MVSSEPGDDWNAIDPNVAVDQAGGRWLAMGSFWSGIKLRKLDSVTGKLSETDRTLYSLANRRLAIPPAVEAPCLVFHEGYYYLFVSFDLCCKGKASTYRIMVGRSKKITGPYVDQDGRAMTDGGGSELLRGNEDWFGPGGESVLLGTGIAKLPDVIAFHAYNAKTGKPALQIAPLRWKQGWPVLGPATRSGYSVRSATSP